MNARRLGLALMVVGVLAAGAGTFSAGVISGDRVSRVAAVGDDPLQEDANYFDTGDATTPFTTIDNDTTTAWYVFDHFGQELVATDVEVVAVDPVDPTANGTTTNDDAVVVDDADFSTGDAVDEGGKGRISLTCNPALNGSVAAEHHVTVHVAVEGRDSGATVSLTRTVTERVEC